MEAVAGRRTGVIVAAAAAAPFVAGRLLYDPTATEVGGPELVCPFRVATGLPCPLCGSTRAIVLAGHGDLGFLDHNAVAVVVLLAVVVLGLTAATVGVGRGARAFLARAGASPGPVLLALVLAGWAWALTHRGTIVS